MNVFLSVAAIFPIRQDRYAVAAIVLVAFVAIPLFATPYAFTGILIPFLILSLAAIGGFLFGGQVFFARKLPVSI